MRKRPQPRDRRASCQWLQQLDITLLLFLPTPRPCSSPLVLSSHLSLFPVSHIFLFSLFRWSRSQLSRGCSCISFRVLVSVWSFSFSSSLCQQHLSPLQRPWPPTQPACPLCPLVAPAWLQDFPYRGHISPENTGLLHVPITILFLSNFWMELDGPDCNAQPLLKLEAALEQRMLLKLLCSVQKVSLNGGRGCPSLFLSSFCWLEWRCAAWSLSPQLASREPRLHTWQGVARHGLNLPPDLPSSVTRGRN